MALRSAGRIDASRGGGRGGEGWGEGWGEGRVARGGMDGWGGPMRVD